ncbi:GNAT family N-acetyltransferase [Gynuella sunshinyii]|uniref:Acetyltransferase, including N-acetylase of ribosomal protein n=1 Tax=Gynuella sunshinyii YC6258 TaxID=1445510 RepID=A0A0C5UYH4_9GAMM|nr:GNAT family N-acetyltransferase [Gynuella sunshinyii]AJQ92335.1 acetyltransferase, including N-acetylase of ribosomal protein [Gynuella sunshinyii YC6258]
MRSPYTFIILEKPEQLDLVYRSLIHLFELSSGDNAILGFENSFTEQDLQAYRRSLNDQLASGSIRILTAQTSKHDVILSCILKQNNQTTTRHVADLQKGFIHPDYRGTGVFNEAMYHIANYAIQRQIDLFTLDVREDSPAHRLWSKIGFITFGILPDYCRYRGRSYRGHYMHMQAKDLWNKFKYASEAAGALAVLS